MAFPPHRLFQHLSPHLAGARAAWARLSARERRLVLTAAVVVAGALAAVAIERTFAEHRRLRHALPQAQAAFARMQQDAAELSALRATPPLSRSADPVGAARAAAAAHGLELQLAATVDGIEARGRAPAAPLLDWIATLHADLGLRATRVELKRDGEALQLDAAFAAAGA
jgi:type II secretory pathway component PulM